jgi:hypothetical protein
VPFVLLWPLRSVLYSSLILSVSASTGVTLLVCPCPAILLLGKKKAQFVLRFDHARVWLARCLFDCESWIKTRVTFFLLKLNYFCGQRLGPDFRKWGMAVRLYGKVAVILVRLRDILSF